MRQICPRSLRALTQPFLLRALTQPFLPTFCLTLAFLSCHSLCHPHLLHSCLGTACTGSGATPTEQVFHISCLQKILSQSSSCTLHHCSAPPQQLADTNDPRSSFTCSPFSFGRVLQADNTPLHRSFACSVPPALCSLAHHPLWQQQKILWSLVWCCLSKTMKQQSVTAVTATPTVSNNRDDSEVTKNQQR